MLNVSYFQSSTQTITFEKIAPPADFKVAFLADQGLTNDSRAVLKLVKQEGASMVIHSGDFDYADNPSAWDTQINEILGQDFPYFASVGNHDLKAWDGYQTKLNQRLERIQGEKCQGEVGVEMICRYNGLVFILSGVGTKGTFNEEFFSKNLENNRYSWRICSWHKNQHLMQVGEKTDEVGWGPYEACSKAGAIIATGHEHSYSRTQLMSSFQTQTVAGTANTLGLSPGKSFAFVSGMAGHSIRPQDNALAKNPWWASIYTASQSASSGALFCSFNTGGQKNNAACYFKDINGKIVDHFSLLSNN